MNQDRRSSRLRSTSRRSQPKLSSLQIAIRILVLSIIVGLLGIAGALVLRAVNQRSSPTSVDINLPVNSSLSPFESLAAGTMISMNADKLASPLSADATPITFIVDSGETASGIGERLVADGLIDDADLFRLYMRYYGLDRNIEAGTYQLGANMTIPEIALALTNAAAVEIVVRITEGWRREQIAQEIDRNTNLPFTGSAYLQATDPGFPIPDSTGLTAVIPAGTSAEGFLFPDTYRLAADATAADLVQKQLENFASKMSPQLQADAAAQGMSLYQIVTLASIVEREAVLADERPLIAGVYLNRLRQGIKLEADPTVQYAMGYQELTDQWWNLGLTQSDYSTTDSPYNTYLYPGLPPSPIANPGLDAIRAVIDPEQSPYLFFRASCDGSGRHNFAVSFDEHLANECP